MKRIAVLGSTGSIGQSALEVIRNFPREFRAVGLAANSNIDILYRQIKEFHPELVFVNDKSQAGKLKDLPGIRGTKVLTGAGGLARIIQDLSIDTIVLAISGAGALRPLLKAIESGKDIALANKEALVMAGSIIMPVAKRKNVKILPIDSEQSAIWQCLDGKDRNKLRNIYLTASGGPFRKARTEDLKKISIKKVLLHPRWKMGRKISVDSATLMNKGLEVLESMHLFNVPCDKIKILIHPEAIIHSMVEFIDGIVLAQLSVTDMRIPIQYALSYPERLNSKLPALDFCKLGELKFEEPDFRRFPCLRLAFQAAKELGTVPAVLNAANEVCVEGFLRNRLDFVSIPKVIAHVLGGHRNKPRPDLGDILEADSWARQKASSYIGS